MSDPSSKQTEPEDLSEFSGTIRAQWDSREERDKQLFKLLTSDDDLVTVALRGHLVMEELLVSGVAAHCDNPSFLKKANLKFSQLIQLFRALEKLPLMKETEWEVLHELNALRNALAHDIEPANLSTRTERLVRMIVGPEAITTFKHPAGSKDSLKQALCHLFGRLSVIPVFQSNLETLIHHQLMAPNKHPSQES